MGTLASELTLKIIADNKDLSASLDKSKKDVKGFADEVARATKVMPSAIISPSAFDNVSKDIRRVKKEMEEVSKPGKVDIGGGTADGDFLSKQKDQLTALTDKIKKAQAESRAFRQSQSAEADAALQREITSAQAYIASPAGKIESLNKSIKEAKNEAKDFAGEITDLSGKASVVFGLMAVGIGATIKSWLDAAGQMETYKAKLETVLKSSEKAKEVMRESVAYAAKTPFNLQGVVDATVQLEVYGAKSKEVLPLVGNLAAGMGKGIEQTSRAVGKFWSGSYEGAERLRNEFGITNQKLQKYGAEVDKQGQLMLRTSGQIDKAREALKKIVQIEFAGAVERQSKTFSGAMSNLSDSVEKLKVGFGEGLAPVVAFVARVTTSLVEVFNLAPQPIKALAAWGTVLAGGFALVGTAALGLAAIMPTLTTAYKILADQMIYENGVLLKGKNATMIEVGAIYSKIKALALAQLGIKSTTVATIWDTVVRKASIAGLIAWSAACKIAAIGANILGAAMSTLAAHPYAAIIIAIVAIASKLFIDSMESNNKKLQEQVNKDEAALQAYRNMSRKYVGKSVQDMREMGLTSAQIEEESSNVFRKAQELYKEGQEAAGKGDYQRANQLYGLSAAMLKGIKQTREQISELKAYENTVKKAQMSIKDFEVSLQMFREAKFFTIPSQELAFFQKQVEDLKPKLEGLLNIKLSGDSEDFSVLIEQRRKALKEIAVLEQSLKNVDNQNLSIDTSGMTDQQKKEQEDSVNKEKSKIRTQIEQKIKNWKDLEEVIKALFQSETEVYSRQEKEREEQWKKWQEDDKQRKADEIQRSRDFIEDKKNNNQMSLKEEMEAQKRILNNLIRQGASEKEIYEQNKVIRKLDADIRKESMNKNLQNLQTELDAIEKFADGQVAAYDRILEKIQQYKSQGKITSKEADDLSKDAKDKRFKKSEDDQKDAYERLETTQSESLNKMKDIGQASIGEQIAQVRRYIRMWEDEERRRPQFKAEIQKRIVALQKQETDLEGEAIKNNREAQKELLNMKKDSIEYEIGKLEEKLEKGEAVENKLIEKLREKDGVVRKQIEEQVKEWERQGLTREVIEEKIALLKRNNAREELDNIQKLIDKLKEQNKEKEKGEKKEGTQIYNSPQDAFAASDLTQALQRDKEEKQRKAEIAALEQRKAELESEIRRQDAQIKKIEDALKKETPGSKAAEKLQTDLDTAKGEKKKTEGLLGVNTPNNIFAGKVDIFASSIDVFRQSVEMFNTLMQNGLKVPSMPAPEEASGSTSGQAGYGNHIVVNINGNQTAAARVSAQKDGQGWMVRIPSNVLASSKPDVKPTSRKLEPFSVGGGPMSVWEAFGQQV